MSRLSIGVVIATAGRPFAANDPIAALERARISESLSGVGFVGVVCAPTAEDTSGLDLPSGWSIVSSERGLTKQRNSALPFVSDCDFVFFFDDDAIPRDDYISAALAAFEQDPTLVGVTGNVIRDGAPSRVEIRVEEALKLLQSSYERFPIPVPADVDASHRELYGCNFAIRSAAISHLRFDERLPLYGWLEDRDFATRAMAHGRLGLVRNCILVHRGSSTGGRSSHERLGYSQVANPLYLWQAGSFSPALSISQLLRPVSKNLVLALVPGAATMFRRDRLRGNFRAFIDLCRNGGRAEPEGILD